jgi:hypothetical protein
MTCASASEIKSALEQLKSESIGKSIANLVARYCNSEKFAWDPSLYWARAAATRTSARST